MKKFIFFLSVCGLIFAQSDLIFKDKYIDPVHAAIKDIRNKNIEKANSETKAILLNSNQSIDEKTMFATLDGIEIPQSNETFNTYFHFPPKHQGLTSSCWAHTGISFIESETNRLQNNKIKLSVMFIVYHDFLDKSLYFIETHGLERIRMGSEINAVFNIAEKYGLIPERIYDGKTTEMGYDLEPMQKELLAYLNFIKKNNFWDKKTNMSAIKSILDKHLGPIPKDFNFQGKKYTCKSFYKKLIKFNPNDYQALQSTLSFPFGEEEIFPFPDHWWHGRDFLNIPLDNFYRSIIAALQAGFTVPIAGDISEPGYNRYAGIAFIPKADIAQNDINQDSREYRIYNESTSDDHAIHIIGYTQINGVDWFLIKDSSRSAYQSGHPGYYYYRGDYVKLKMLNAIVPKYLIDN